MEEWVGQITLINVGNGDAILVEVPDQGCREGRFIMMIDGGSGEDTEYADSSTGRIRAVDYLEQKGIQHIDVMVSTHIHEDHTCGLLSIAKRWPPNVLWQPFPKDILLMMKPLEQVSDTESGRKFIAALNDFGTLCKLVTDSGGCIRQITPHHTKHRSLFLAKGVYVKVLGPSRRALEQQVKWMKALYQENQKEVLPLMDAHMNSVSILLYLTCFEKTFLLTGDTESDCYEECMEDIKADVFKIGHHGQANSLTMEILQAVSPQFAAICVSSDRRYESGAPIVLQMLTESGVLTYYSDCPKVPPYTDGVEPHKAILFQVMLDGTLRVQYEKI